MPQTNTLAPPPAEHLDERAYQAQVKVFLDRLYEQVQIQWAPFRGEGHEMYEPVVDVAVGPFATRQRFMVEYGELLDRTRPFIERLIEKHNLNVRDSEEPTHFVRVRDFNQNARCLLCIEIEASGSRKHCLGNLVNASALGRIGILVARNAEMKGIFLRQRAYLHFLAEVQKNTFKTENALVLTEEQFDECLAEGNNHT